MRLRRATDDDVVRFFTRLYENADPGKGWCLEVRGIWPDRSALHPRSCSQWFPLANGKGTYKSAVNYARTINNAGYDAFFGVNPRCPNGQEDEDCMAGVALWIDVDGLADVEAAEARLSEVLAHPLPADMAVFTGGGVHVYWVLKEPYDPAEPDYPRYPRSLKAMAKRFGGDPKVTNLSRVLRVPGSVSRKRNCETLLWMRSGDAD